MRGDDTPPVSKFAWPKLARAEVELEFLVSARGDGSRPTVEVQVGVPAQVLRELRILEDNPQSISIDDRSPLASDVTFRGTVRVPRIGHFVIQKALFHGKRIREKQVKDVFYVFDLIDRENGLADAVLADVVQARRNWSKEVERFQVVLGQRAREPAFLKQVSEQLPAERRPLVAYVERELTDWLDRLTQA